MSEKLIRILQQESSSKPWWTEREWAQQLLVVTDDVNFGGKTCIL